MQVFLYSEEHGLEIFDYETETEAIAGYKRLKKAAIKSFKQDKIQRKVILVKDCFTTEV